MKDARAEDKELSTLRNSAKDMSTISLKKAKTVAIVGSQGMGKSLMINSLLNRQKISKTSAGGGACTAAAIKYRHKVGSDDLDDLMNAQIQFMDDQTLRETIEEHVHRYFHFHFSGSVTEEYYEEEKRCAQAAESFFHLI